MNLVTYPQELRLIIQNRDIDAGKKYIEGLCERVESLKNILEESPSFRFGALVGTPVHKAAENLLKIQQLTRVFTRGLESRIVHLEAERAKIEEQLVPLEEQFEEIDAQIQEIANLSNQFNDCEIEIANFFDVPEQNYIDFPRNSQEDEPDVSILENSPPQDGRFFQPVVSAALKVANRLEAAAQPYLKCWKKRTAKQIKGLRQFAYTNRGYAASLALNAIFIGAYLLRR